MGNFERMILLAEEVFAVHDDPGQLDVNEHVIRRLVEMHPSAVTELSNEEGPYVWLLLIPSTEKLMKKFLAGEISEKELFGQTRPGMSYDVLYLCSVMVLEEFRKRGLAEKLARDAIRRVRKDFPIHTLFTWNFTKEGARLAERIAQAEELPLLVRPR